MGAAHVTSRRNTMSTDDFSPDDQAILDQLGIGHDEETDPQAGEQPSA